MQYTESRIITVIQQNYEGKLKQNELFCKQNGAGKMQCGSEGTQSKIQLCRSHICICLKYRFFCKFFMWRRKRKTFKPKPEAMCHEKDKANAKIYSFPGSYIGHRFFLEIHPELKGFGIQRLWVSNGVVQGHGRRGFFGYPDVSKKKYIQS